MKKDFFFENDVAVTKTAVKVLRWLILVFPLLILLSVVGLFQSKLSDLIPLTVMGLVVTTTPSIASKLHAPVKLLKYLSTLSLACLIASMASNWTIGIYMTYALAMVFSIFYYDKKFTLHISIISYLLLVVSLYFRSINIPQIEYDSNFVWFISRSMGFLLEAIVMTIVCIKISDVSHKMLENLADTKQVADLVQECSSASNELNTVVTQLDDCIQESQKTTNIIADSAHDTVSDCNNSIEYVDNLYHSIDEMNHTTTVIASETEKMLSIAEESVEKMQSYINRMNETTKDMKNIEESAHSTEESIKSLEDGMKEISEFAATIGAITKQTNLLSLNASIEAARAGEMGKGFSVVADQVRTLADDSKKASDAINNILEKIFALLQEVHTSNDNNLQHVFNGINQLKEVSTETQQLSDIQGSSKDMAANISSVSEDTKKAAEKILTMADKMRDLVQNTLNQANQIVQESESQKNVTENVKSAFNQVSAVSQNLLALSNLQ